MSVAHTAPYFAARRILERLATKLDPHRHRLVVHCDEDLMLTQDQAEPLLHAAWEAIVNALRHAYPLGSDEKVWVRLHGHGHVTLSVRDMGKGLPDLTGKRHPGIDAIEACARALAGRVLFKAHPYGGLEVALVFPER